MQQALLTAIIVLIDGGVAVVVVVAGDVAVVAVAIIQTKQLSVCAVFALYF